MAWKTITLHGWWVSFERDSDWYLRHEEVSGFSSIEKIEVEGIETPYTESDIASVETGRTVTKYPTKYAPALLRRKSDKCFTIKINARKFDPKLLVLHYADVVIKIGDEEIDTACRIVRDITYNGRKCQLRWVSSGEREYQTIIWYKSPFIYDSCWFAEDAAAVSLNGEDGFIDAKGNVFVPFEYTDAEQFQNGYAPVRIFDEDEHEYKWGYINKRGEEVIPCKYEEVHHFFDGRAYVEDGDYGFIDEKGNEVVPCCNHILRDGWGGTYYHHDFSEGRAILSKNYSMRCGYIDENGKEITPLKYWRAEPFSEGLGAVRNKEKWGFVDKEGVEVIPCTYSEAKSFSEGLAAVKINDRWGFIDKSNTLVIPCKYQEVYSFSEGLASVKIGKKWGFIDKSGDKVIPCIYSDVYAFENGMAPVCQCKKWGYIDKCGKLIVPCIYDHAENFKTNGLACVSKGNKMGCIDRTGKVIIPLIYDYIGNHETRFSAKIEEKWGLLNIEGNPIEDFAVYKALAKKYDQVWIECGETRTYSFVLDGKYGLADAEGNELIPPRYDWTSYSGDGMIVVGIYGKGIGFINIQGEEIVAPKYEEVTNFHKGFAAVRLNGKWGAINKRGEVVVPFTHDAPPGYAREVWVAQ